MEIDLSKYDIPAGEADEFQAGGQTFRIEPDEGGVPIPLGHYILEITGGENTLSSKHQRMLSMEYEIVQPEQYAGRRVWDYLMQEGKGAYRAREAMVAFGVPAPQPGEPIIGNVQQLFNKQFAATLKWDLNPGYWAKPVVEKYLPGDNEIPF